MNKYRDKSDFEINKAVAIAIGFPCYYGNGSYTNGLGLRAAIVKGENTSGNYMLGSFDPCNNPADAMPIVIENGISLISDWNEIGVWGATYQPWWTSENKNPLRAAMEVFLMMKDAENENV